MPEPVTIRPDRLRSFGNGDGSTFCLVTEAGWTDSYRVEPGGGYSAALVLEYDSAVDFEEFLTARVPEPAHVLVILPTTYFRSPSPDALGPRRKLAAMACTSTPTSLDAIAHFVGVGERTDPEVQEVMVDAFFTRGQQAARMRFVDDTYGAVAEFEHLGDDLVWHEQAGTLGWGEQQLFPSGEVSVLPVQVFGQNIEDTLRLDGTLALRGTPVLHSGVPSFLPRDQHRLFDRLSCLEEDAVLAEVKAGRIVDFTPTTRTATPAAQSLEAMCDVDSRYSTVLEIGFGVNTALSLFPGNSAMNEVYGGTSGTVHIGLGLTPYTQYHLDIICPYLRVEDEAAQWIFGVERGS